MPSQKLRHLGFVSGFLRQWHPSQNRTYKHNKTEEQTLWNTQQIVLWTWFEASAEVNKALLIYSISTWLVWADLHPEILFQRCFIRLGFKLLSNSVIWLSPQAWPTQTQFGAWTALYSYRQVGMCKITGKVCIKSQETV